MNFIKHYKGWRERMTADKRITGQHVLVYLTLFDVWNNNRFRNPVVIFRTEAMQLSKISSPNVYFRCLKELSNWGYIGYMPSFNPRQVSQIHLYRFDTGHTIGSDTGNDTPQATGTNTATAISPYNINTNNINYLNTNGHSNNTSISDNNWQQNPNPQAVDSGAGHHQPTEKETAGGRAAQGGGGAIPSSLEEAQAYFQQIGSTALEGKTFFSHYKSVGWKINGIPIANWQALADKWLIKSNELAASRPKPKHAAGRLHVEENKDYSKPL